MKRVILTSSSGVGLAHADRADMVVPFIFRFVSGPLPTSHHLEQYLTGGYVRGDPEVRWSDLVGRLPQTGLAHKETGLIWFCETYSVDLIELWFDPDAPEPRPSSGALLLPLYDEVTLSYPVLNFPSAYGHPHQPGEDLFVGCIIIAETNVGLWRRSVKGRKMIMEITLAPGVMPDSRPLVEAAAVDLASFTGKELELTISS